MLIDITCNFCGKTSQKERAHVNRANKDGMKLFCNRKCFGLSTRLNKTKAQQIEDKRLYDDKYRKVNKTKIKTYKAEAFKRDYDPVKAAIIRKERMPYHVKYCQSPEYKEWKREYDRKYRAKTNYGEFWEAFLLLMNLDEEVYSRMDKQQIRLMSGTHNKTQQRHRYERSNSTKLERSTLGNPQ